MGQLQEHAALSRTHGCPVAVTKATSAAVSKPVHQCKLVALRRRTRAVERPVVVGYTLVAELTARILFVACSRVDFLVLASVCHRDLVCVR